MNAMQGLAAGFIGPCSAATLAAPTFPTRPIRVVERHAPAGTAHAVIEPD